MAEFSEQYFKAYYNQGDYIVKSMYNAYSKMYGIAYNEYYFRSLIEVIERYREFLLNANTYRLSKPSRLLYNPSTGQICRQYVYHSLDTTNYPDITLDNPAFIQTNYESRFLITDKEIKRGLNDVSFSDEGGKYTYYMYKQHIIKHNDLYNGIGQNRQRFKQCGGLPSLTTEDDDSIYDDRVDYNDRSVDDDDDDVDMEI